LFVFSFVNELRCRFNGSGLGNVGIEASADAPTLGVKDKIGFFISVVGNGFDTIGALLVTAAFFLNNGVNKRCSSKRNMITGCITDDKYEKLYKRLSLEFNIAVADVGLAVAVVV
jgi:hypothetical protein